MAHDTFRQTNLPNESDEYLSKREQLRLAEIDLLRQRERVAELRRSLPQGAAVQDYAFEEGPANLDAGDTPIRTVRLSELFSGPNRTLVVYHFMFGKKMTTPCPMCTLGSMAGTVSLIIWLRTSTLQLSRRPIQLPCEHTRAHAVGTD